MMSLSPTCSAKEARLVHLFREVVPNAGRWAEDVGHTYIEAPVKEGNYPKVVFGAAAAVGSAVTDFGDYLIAGVVDKELQPPDGARFGRLRRDGVEFIKDVTHFKILATAADVIRLPGSAVMDTVDVTLGFSHDPRLQTFQVDTHDGVMRTLDAKQS